MGSNRAVENRSRKVLVVVLWQGAEGCKVLCMKRPEESGAYWQTVTGGLEPEEDFLEAAVRETIEETGLRRLSPPRYLGIQHEFIGRWGPATERAYAVDALDATLPPIHLDPKEHIIAEWLSPEEAMGRVMFPMNKEAICRAAFPPSPLILTENGEWFQDGEQITHERTAQFLHKHLMISASGTYCVRYGEEQLTVQIQDTARFVKAITAAGMLQLLDGREEALQPAALHFGDRDILYTEILGERVRFFRSAQYELLKHVTEATSADGQVQYTLHWLGRDYPLSVPTKGEGINR